MSHDNRPDSKRDDPAGNESSEDEEFGERDLVDGEGDKKNQDPDPGRQSASSVSESVETRDSGEGRPGDRPSVDLPPPEEAAQDQKGRNLLVPDVERWSTEKGPIISLENVNKYYGDKHVLKDLTLEIAAGETTVIIGASGSGKSVLIKHMNGLILPEEGKVCLFGHDTREMGVVELDRLRKRIGTLFQNYALFDSMSVVDNVAFPLIQNGAMDEDEARERSAELLEDLGLGASLHLYPASISGGMKKRVSLARAMIANPEVILFDEPTTGLDPIMMEFVDEMIMDINVRYGLTSVIISHDMASTLRLADSIAVLHQGQIIAHDSPDAIRAMDDDRVLRLVSGGDKTAINVDDAAQGVATEDHKPAVVIRGLRKSFGAKEVLKHIDLTIPEDGITVLIGGSGAGKSVLMKHLLGLMRGDSGSVDILGRDVAELDDHQLSQLRTRIGMLFQHAALFDSLTVAENVAFPLVERSGAPSREEVQNRLDRVLKDLKIDDIAKSYPAEISNGAQKRVSLARALISEPDIMIYDEPTTGQDPVMSAYVEQMILDAQERFELTSIVISHDMASTFRIGDHVALLHEGCIIAEGPPASLLTSEDQRVRDFVFAADVSQAKRSSSEPRA